MPIQGTQKEVADLIAKHTAPLLGTIKKLEVERAKLVNDKARTHAGLVAARTAIYQGALRLPYPGKFGLQTIIKDMDICIQGRET